MNRPETGLTEADRRRLESGELLVSSETASDRARARAIGLVDAPPDVVWDVITDYDGYREFMPMTVESRVERVEGNSVDLFMELKVLIKRIRYRIRLFLDRPARTVDWERIDGDLKANEGSWRLAPYDNGGASGRGRTLATYTVRLEIGFFVPAAIADRLTKGSFPALYKAVRERAASVAR
ncbi:MAG: SRPBCC family protein [Planctomycetes bacterium]|nr:SRPBCC family protein [Planctomycetota bacterium]